ncbi:hypothetical protein [Limnoglobus roseus]|uniref:Uncharacterized protein n=1 Tax=Limnoglobus roseus TaxID=2598579 RepID=A0A5C1A983_9BACT|nr:hypothetical protein [Limnoglobus roseus]QEL14606.1 hypothetical protein PX52LOC_01497 [Limnoglobus roseus]
MTPITREMLRDYIHDALPDHELPLVERALRDLPSVQALFNQVRQELDRGEHSIGAIWRRERLSCPTREQLGGFLLDALDPDLHEYIAFHLKTVGCPHCSANLDDLTKRQAEAEGPVKTRRQRILKSTAGVLRNATGT